MAIKLRADDQGSEGKNILLAIGIDQYQHLSKLNGCVKDAKNLAETLTTRYRFAYEDLILILDEEATKSTIYTHFSNLLRVLQPQDCLIIYYSGLANYDKKLQETYWMPSDAQQGKRHSYIPFSELKRFISAFKAHQVLVIADASDNQNILQS